MGDDTKLLNEVDFVGKDKIWRDYVANEVKSVKIWQNQWGFLRGDPLDLIRDKLPPPSSAEQDKLELPTTLRVRSVTPISRYITVNRSVTVPRTTTGQVGWRSADPNCQLEIYGRDRHVKGDILKKFKWPIEACV